MQFAIYTMVMPILRPKRCAISKKGKRPDVAGLA